MIGEQPFKHHLNAALNLESIVPTVGHEYLYPISYAAKRNPEFPLSYRMFNRILIFFRSKNPRRRSSSNYYISDPSSDREGTSTKMQTRSKSSQQGRHDSISSKLSDDELVEQFSGRSFGDKLAIFRRILRQSHQSFDDFIKAWIRDTAGDTYHGTGRQKKAKRILDIIWEDENELLPLFENTESFKERVVKSTVKIIRSELQVLNKKVKALGKFDPTANPEELDFQGVIGSIKEHAQNTFQLLHGAAENQRRDKYTRHDSHGRVLTIVSILSLGRAQTTSNSFGRSLGLYLYTAGVPRRALTLLNSLGITDSYQSIRRAVEAIKQSSQVNTPFKNKPSKIFAN